MFLVELVCCLSDIPSDYLKSKKKVKKHPVTFGG